MAVVLLTSSALTGCSAVDRMKAVGEAPKQAAITNPTMDKNYKPVSMPMPAEKLVAKSRPKDNLTDMIGEIKTTGVDCGSMVLV